jgi:xanthine dehydrogenase large subunit
MNECTERSEGRECMPKEHSMNECTERSEGRECLPRSTA